jgi:hypothetical protein
MKFFTNLPQKKYSTEIGDINICSFYSFYKKQFQNKRQNTLTIDDKTTLVEASMNVFNDTDSLWIFLYTNNWINPFTLTDYSASLFLAQSDTKTSFNPYATTSGYYPAGGTFSPATGSILTEYVGSTSGKPWEYTYVGHFNLNGSFNLVESRNSYNVSATVKSSDGEQIIYPSSNDITALTFILKGDTYYSSNNNVTAKNNIVYSEGVVQQVSAAGDSTLQIPDAGPQTENSAPSFLPTALPTNISLKNYLQTKTKQINYISPLDITSSLSVLVTPKYSAI